MQGNHRVYMCFYTEVSSCGVFFSLKQVKVLVTWSCPTLCNTRDCSPPVSSVHGILQARILKWVAIPFSRGFSWPRDWTLISHTAGRFLTMWFTREAHILVTTVKFQCHLTFSNDIGLLFFLEKIQERVKKKIVILYPLFITNDC